MAEIIDITPPTEEEVFLGILQQLYEENEKALFVVDNARMEEMREALRLISPVILDNDPEADIECGFCPLFKQDGVIRIETSELCVNALNMERFQKALLLASDFDVVPVDEGRRVRIGLSFHDVMIRMT